MSEGGAKGRVWFWGTRLLFLGLFAIAACGVMRFTKKMESPPEVDASLFNEPRPRQPIGEQQAPPVELTVLEEQLQKELLAATGEVEALRQERRRMPVDQRCCISAGTNAFAQAVARKQHLQYRMAELACYEKNTRDSGEAKRLGAAFLTEYLKFAASTADAPGKEILREMAETAMDAGAADPIVRIYYARILSHYDEMEQSLRIVEEVKVSVLQGTYPAITKYCARTWPLMLPHKDRPNGQLRLDPAVIEAAIIYLEEEAHYDNQRIVYKPIAGLFDGADPAGKAALYEAVVRSKTTDPWIRHMIVGRYYVSKACSSRGEDWASKVTPEGWQGFHDYLPRGAAHLRRAWQLRPEYPEAATCMIDVAKLGADPEWSPQDWFYEATRAQLDHNPAYGALRGALLPRWGGSYEEMLALANDCLDTKRWDTYVPCQTVNILFEVQQEFLEADEFAAVPGVAPLAKRVAEELLLAAEDDPGIAANHPGIRAYLVATLVRTHEFALARRIFEELGDDIRQVHLEWAGMKLSTARGRAYANTGPAQEAVQFLEKALARGGFMDPSPEYFETLRSRLGEVRRLDETPQVQPYLDDIAAVIDQLERFYAGKSVELPLDESLTGWYVQGEVHQEPEAWIRVKSFQGTGGVQLKPLANFVPPFAVEAELDVAHNLGQSSWTGILIGPADQRAVYHLPLTRSMLVNSYNLFMMTRVGVEETGKKHLTFDEPPAQHHLLVKLWPGRIQLYHNGELQADDATLPENPPAAITLGNWMPDNWPSEFKCRNIRIQRLSEEPPPPPDVKPEQERTAAGKPSI